MIRKRVDSKIERSLVTAMIVSVPFLSAASEMDVELLQSEHTRRIAKWCVRYFRKHGAAPGKSIESIYNSWLERKKPDEGDARAVEDLLSGLSDDYDQAGNLNVPFLIEELQNHLNRRRLTVLIDDAQAALAIGRERDAIESVQSFRTVSMADTSSYFPLRDLDRMGKAFISPPESLFAFPGVASRFFAGAFTRDSLVGIQGPEKRGKTWWCLEFMYRALRSRRRVAFFEVGDLSEAQLELRLGCLVAGRPTDEYQATEGFRPPVALEIERDDDEEVPNITYGKQMKFKSALTDLEACRALKRFVRTHRLSERNQHLMFSVHPNSSINVRGIHGILDRYRHEQNFIPDVIIIDYADILAPEDARQEHRHRVNETWQALRRLSQDWHASVIVPTQAAASAYDVKTQRMKNFSEDKRKYSHVTAMLGLNQTSEEKKLGVMRLNWIVRRESQFHSERCLWVAQCLPLGKALVCSAIAGGKNHAP